MEATDKNIAWMIGRITEFQHYPGYPNEGSALIGTAKRILAIVKNEAVVYWDSRNDKRVEVPNDLDWLLEWIGRECERFPLPTQMRIYYQRKFKPADGHEVPTVAEDEE